MPSTASTHIRTLTAAALLGLTSAAAAQQPSLIAQLQEAQNALVKVHAQNTQLLRGPGRMAFDPRTGRFIKLSQVGGASFERNGAGVAVHPSGVVVTNAHIVLRADRIAVQLRDGTTVPAQVLEVIKNLDLALLKINPPRPLPVVTLADSDRIKLGDSITTIGTSRWLDETFSGGRITGIGTGRSDRNPGEDRRTDLIQMSFNVYEGDSGGPVFNDDGELLGLVTARDSSAERVSFAIPSNKIARYLAMYLRQQPAPAGSARP